MRLAALAGLLGGEVSGRNRLLMPGPGHSPDDRSLSVRLDRSAPDGFCVNSFAGDDWRDCRDHVRQALGLNEFGVTRLADSKRSMARRAPEPELSSKPRVLWQEAVPITGTPAELHLALRGLAYSGEALRWHPSCPFGKERLGCMLGLVRNIRTNEIQAIHRTAIAPDGVRIGRKAMGPIGGGAIKLTDDADVTLALGIGEGLETTLSLKSMVDVPVWSVMNANGIAAFPALSGIETLWIAVDNDEAGMKAEAACVERMEAAGIETISAVPDVSGADLNDGIRRDA